MASFLFTFDDLEQKQPNLRDIISHSIRIINNKTPTIKYPPSP